jgi:hypothetical protein
VETLTRGLPPPDPCVLCPLSSIEFVGTLLNIIPGCATGGGWGENSMILATTDTNGTHLHGRINRKLFSFKHGVEN